MILFSGTEGTPLRDVGVYPGAIFYPPFDFVLGVGFLQLPDVVGELSAAGVLLVSCCSHVVGMA